MKVRKVKKYVYILFMILLQLQLFDVIKVDFVPKTIKEFLLSLNI